jgi:alkylation response protein AidB-like acyl-CoA dehydrogenase
VALTGEGRPIQGIDPSLGLVEVAAAAAPLAEERLAAGRRALAHELVGCSRAMLALARDHAVDRIQFGVPIASFQAVRHRLAESLVAVESAAAAAEGAWQDEQPLTAALAKAVAGRSARTVARHAQQVLAGVGFTTEHPFHHHLRRALALDALLGDTRTLTRDLGRQLLADRRAPRLLPL